MRKLRQSIFLKLLLVFVFAAAANLFVMRVFQRHFLSNSERRLHRLENWVEYSRFLALSLGPVPTAEKIREMADRLHLQIRAEGSMGLLVSSPTVPHFEDVDAKINTRLKTVDSTIGKYSDFLAIQTQLPSGKYLFLFESEDALGNRSDLVIGVSGVLLIILLATYLAISRILGPLKSLEKGVRSLSNGDLNVSLPMQTDDELGRLVQSFNHMTQQVRAMIESKEQLLLDVSHEFRSPLTRIKVAMELHDEESVDMMRRAVRELETMISELLESARLNDTQGRLKLENTDLDGLVTDLVSMYDGQKPGIVLARGGGEPLWCRLDPARMRTALRNILENALKYSSHQDQPVEVSVHHSGARAAEIRVRDYGVGIPKDEQRSIFEPFYRIDRSRVKSTGGYGLGLSLCRKIIAAHRGQIRVHSEPGHRTDFLIELPIV